MIPSNVLDSIYCSLSHLNNHFVEHPIALNCGHSACKKCVSKVTQPFYCGKCNAKIKIDIDKVKESQIFKSIFNSYFNELFKIPYKNLKVYYYRAQR
jgi:Fe2+ or Zn2+ uptake regulation protein